jgi:hypothetical protein
MQEPCGALDAWLHNTAHAPLGTSPAAELADHVAGCPRCKGRLAALIGAHDKSVAQIGDQACATFEEQLPMLVDYRRSQGLAATARTFPALWWHTLTCPTCAASYRLLQQAAATPAEPWQAAGSQDEAQPQPAQRPRLRMQIRMPGSIVRQLFAAEGRLGPAWSSGGSDMIISEEDHELCRLQLYLRRKIANRVTLVVRTDPPARGVATLNVGPAAFYLQLDEEGSAVFADLSDNLFDAEADLSVTLDTLF